MDQWTPETDEAPDTPRTPSVQHACYRCLKYVGLWRPKTGLHVCIRCWDAGLYQAKTQGFK